MIIKEKNDIIRWQRGDTVIKYEEGIERTYTKNSQVEKERQKLLEKALRTIGNFDDNKPIEITRLTVENDNLDYIYEVEDLDKNLFTFKNFGIDNDYHELKRFRENYHLYVKRPNTKVVYKYDFKEHKYNKEHDIETLRLIEVSYPLTDNLTVILERARFSSIRIIVKIGNKKYIIGYNDLEYDLELLENFGQIIEKLFNLETINIDNLLHIVPNINKVSFCRINKNDNLIASVSLENGVLYSYTLIDKYKEIYSYIGEETTKRNVEANNKKICGETLDNDNGVLQMEINRLMKRL